MLLALVACHPPDPAEPWDLAFTGGVVYTMDPSAPTAEALAVTGGRIAYVGATSDVEARVGPDTTVVDLAGKALFPGFVDAHAHPVWGGMDLELIDLYAATTMDELLAAVRDYAAAHPDEEWLQGSGWDASIFEGQMTRQVLDAVVSDRPVFLLSADGHSAWVNSRALAIAGVTADTPDPRGGIIVRDDDGEPTGVLRESAVELVYAYVPDLGEASIDAGLQAAQDEFLGFGVTTVIDANADSDALDAYARADATGALRMRVYGAVELDPERGAGQIARVTEARNTYESDRLHVDAVKLYLDGVIESETAWMIDPYEDGTNGEQLLTDERVDELFAAADAEGLQIHVHAIGDAAVRQVLDGVERLEAARGPADRRTLAAHIEVIDPEDVPRFAELGVYADVQPLWAYPDTYVTELTVPYIGEDRAAWLYPIGDVVATGAELAAGSDWDVSSQDPWEAIEVALTRQDPDVPGDVLDEAQRIDLATILAAYTVGGAHAVFEEDELGTLTVGKRADLVVVDRDPFAIDPYDLSDVTVVGTWLDGERVYAAETGTAKRRVSRH